MDTEAAQPLPPEALQREGAASSNAPPLGRIGPYQLNAALAHDGLGQVFKAWDSSERMDVMVTLLDLEADAHDRDAIIARLQKSVLQAAALKHPGLVRIHDAGVVGQGVYIVNEWVAGRTLGLAQRAGWQPTARVAATVVRDLAKALDHAHAHGVLHGGLNPSTVILDNNDRARVLGLGYAGAAHASDVPSMDPLVSGAAPYMAPEQLQGGAPDERTDVHALGVLLYELLAGHRAYPGDTVPEVARALMSHDPAPPHWLRLDVPERLSAIAMQALQRNPAARYAQVGQMAAALNAWLDQAEQELGDASEDPESAQSHPQPQKRKQRRLTAALLVAAAAVVAFVWVDKPGTNTVPARDGAAPGGPGSGVVSGVVTTDDRTGADDTLAQQPVLPAPAAGAAVEAAAATTTAAATATANAATPTVTATVTATAASALAAGGPPAAVVPVEYPPAATPAVQTPIVQPAATDTLKVATLGASQAKPLAAQAPAEPTPVRSSLQKPVAVAGTGLAPQSTPQAKVAATAKPTRVQSGPQKPVVVAGSGAAPGGTQRAKVPPPKALTAAPLAAPASVQRRAQAPATEARTRTPDSRPPARERPPPVQPAAEPRVAAAPAVVQTGTVQLAVSPWGYVEVGGRLAGASPPLQKLTLPEGSHTITIRNEDFAPYVTTVRVSAGKAATVRYRFPQ